MYKRQAEIIEEAVINPAVEGAIPYDMTPPAEGDNVSHIPDMGQRDDTTPDQDDPNAPDVKLRTEQNDDAGKDDDLLNTDGMVADSTEQDAAQEEEKTTAELTHFNKNAEVDAASYQPLPTSEGNAPIIVVEEEPEDEMPVIE